MIPCQYEKKLWIQEFQTFWIADQNWPDVQGCCSTWIIHTGLQKSFHSFHFCSDQTYLTRATYIATFIATCSSNYYWNLRHCAYKVFRLFPLLSPNNLWPLWKTIAIINSLRGTNRLILKSKPHSLLGYRIYMVLRLWPLVTSNDLWPSRKTIGITHFLRGTYILRLKFNQLFLLQILRLESFETLNCIDPKWPLTAMENNRDHLLTKGYLYNKFEVQATFNSWDIVFTKFWYFDLCWPQMTFELYDKQ